MAIDDINRGDGWEVTCPYCGKKCEVGSAEINDDETNYECEHCKHEFICWGESDYTYFSKRLTLPQSIKRTPKEGKR